MELKDRKEEVKGAEGKEVKDLEEVDIGVSDGELESLGAYRTRPLRLPVIET